MSPPGRPKGEFRSAQHGGYPMSLLARCFDNATRRAAAIVLWGCSALSAMAPAHAQPVARGNRVDLRAGPAHDHGRGGGVARIDVLLEIV